MTDIDYWNWRHTVEAAIVAALIVSSMICLVAIILDARKSRSFRERRRRIQSLRPVPDPRSSLDQHRRLLNMYNDSEHR